MIDQGLFLKRRKEGFENQDGFKQLEKKFNSYLNEYDMEYSKLLNTTGEDMSIQKQKVEKLNNKLLEITDIVYQKIVDLKRKKNNQPKFNSNQLEKSNQIKGISQKDLITSKAFEEDYRLKMNSSRVKVIIWTILAKTLLIGTVLFFVVKGHDSTFLKIVLFTAALIVGYILLNITLDTFVRYCKDSKKTGNFICYLLTRVFNI